MKQILLDFLVCPYCKQSFELSIIQQVDQEIVEGGLRCGSCGRSWQIDRGIPRIAPNELISVVKQNVDAFGNEWTHLAQVEQKNEDEFLSYLTPLTKDIFAKQMVLDAGCGMGKFTRLVGSYQAQQVIAVDLSQAVEAAYQNTKHLPNVHIVQADIYNLPLRPFFDVIYSIGVLHHLPDSKDAFITLTKLLKPGGTIFAWVYGREGNDLYIYLADPIRKWITSRLPFSLNVALAHIIAIILWLFTVLFYYPLSKITFLQHITERLPYYAYFLYFKKLGYRLFAGTILDKMIPTISQYFSRDEFNDWFKEAGLTNVSISQRNGNSWRGFATKG